MEERQRAIQTDLDKEKQPRKRNPAHTCTYGRRKCSTTHSMEEGEIKHSSRKWGTSGEVATRVLAAGSERSRGPWGGPMHSGGSPWGQGPAWGPGGCGHGGQLPGGRPAPKWLQNRGSEGKLGSLVGREGQEAEGNRDCGRDSPSAAASWGSALGHKQTPSIPLKCPENPSH